MYKRGCDKKIEIEKKISDSFLYTFLTKKQYCNNRKRIRTKVAKDYFLLMNGVFNGKNHNEV